MSELPPPYPEHQNTEFGPVRSFALHLRSNLRKRDPDLLSKVQGFQDCGCLGLNAEGDNCNNIESSRLLIHEQLAGMDTKQQYRDKKERDEPERDEQQRDNLACQPSATGSKYISSAKCTDLNPAISLGERNRSTEHIYKIHMFSTGVTFINPGRGHTTHLLFKWAKPQSPYGALTGFWEDDLIKVVNDGMLRAGEELMLLVRRVSDQQMEDLRAHWREGTRVSEF